MIHSYHQGLQWTDDISRGINLILQDEGLDIHFEYLDTKRNTGEQYYQNLVEFEKQNKKLANISFDIIICSDNNALRFIVENGDELYPGIPIVFCGVNNFNESMLAEKKDIVGIKESINYRSTLDLIHTLHPKRNNIVFILDNSPTGKEIRIELESVLSDFKDTFSFSFYQDFILSDVPNVISHLGDKDIIYLLTFNNDQEGKFISYRDGIEIIRENSQVPIYGSWDFYFGNGIIGGMLTSGESQGKSAALLALKILKGTHLEAEDFIIESPNQFMFDFKELNRFGIGENQLPPHSQLINKPESWIQQSARSLIVFIVLILSMIFIFKYRLIKQKREEIRLKKINLKLEKRVWEKTVDLTEKMELIEVKNQELQIAMDHIKTLTGIIPICSHCKNIRDDHGFWGKVEKYISENTDAVFSHSLCPECLRKVYPDEANELLN